MTKRELRDRCERLRSHILARQYAPALEVAQHWPEPDWPKKVGPAAYLSRWPTGPWAELARLILSDDLDPWWSCYCALRCINAVGHHLYGRSEGQQEMLLKAAAAEPEEVELSDGQVVQVHPKSQWALMWFRERNWVLDWWEKRTETLRRWINGEEGLFENGDGPSPDELGDPMDLLEQAALRLGSELAEVTAAALQPGPGLDETALERQADQWLHITPFDTLLIHRAFWMVNFGRLAGLGHVAGGGSSGKKAGRISWDVFDATMAVRLSIPLRKITREISLAELILTATQAQTGLEV